MKIQKISNFSFFSFFAKFFKICNFAEYFTNLVDFNGNLNKLKLSSRMKCSKCNSDGQTRPRKLPPDARPTPAGRRVQAGRQSKRSDFPYQKVGRNPLLIASGNFVYHWSVVCFKFDIKIGKNENSKNFQIFHFFHFSRNFLKFAILANTSPISSISTETLIS